MRTRLEEFLRFKLPHATKVSVVNLERLPGGYSKETWSFDTGWEDKGKETYRGFIMRRDSIASLLEVNQRLEFLTMQRLATYSMPIPKVYWLEMDKRWLGRPFIIMERINGKPVDSLAHEDVRLRRNIARQFMQIIVKLHKIDWKKFWPGSRPQPKNSEECAKAQIDKWEKVINSMILEPRPILVKALIWLKNNIPKNGSISLVHGDYRGENLLCDGKKIIAVLDWEIVHIGDPMEDLGWACMKVWRRGNLESGLLTRKEFFHYYEQLTETKIDKASVHFYEVLGNVKMAAIHLTGARLYCDGKTIDMRMGWCGLALSQDLDEIANLIGL